MLCSRKSRSVRFHSWMQNTRVFKGRMADSDDVLNVRAAGQSNEWPRDVVDSTLLDVLKWRLESSNLDSSTALNEPLQFALVLFQTACKGYLPIFSNIFENHPDFKNCYCALSWALAVLKAAASLRSGFHCSSFSSLKPTNWKLPVEKFCLGSLGFSQSQLWRTSKRKNTHPLAIS